jgi:molybdate transport system substrate-binding protein
VAPHVAAAENTRAAVLYVDRTETPLGIVYATDAASDPKAETVGIFPADTHPPIIYPIALTAASRNANAAKFVAFSSRRWRSHLCQVGLHRS